MVGRRREEHWAGRLYMRRVSVHVTRLAVRLGIGADAVTVLMLVVGLAGSAAVFVGDVWPTLAAIGAIQLYLLLDCIDGEVARWNRTESARGVYLDQIRPPPMTRASVVVLTMGDRPMALADAIDLVRSHDGAPPMSSPSE